MHSSAAVGTLSISAAICSASSQSGWQTGRSPGMGLFGALFRPSKKQVWHQLCDEIGATYVSGGF